MAPKATPKVKENPTPTRKSGKASAKPSKAPKARGKTGSSKAGLIFPVGRIGRYLRQGRHCERLGQGASVFLAATLEYLVCEILELAGNAAKESGRKTITPRHLQLAVRNDEELAKLMAATLISNGGYMSNIHPFLLPGKKGAKKGDTAATQEM